MLLSYINNGFYIGGNMIKNFKASKNKQYISYILLAIFFIHSTLISAEVLAAEQPEVKQVYNEKIARGIYFEQNNYSNYLDRGISENEYIITADLNDPTVQVITGKANDKVLSLDTLSNQIASEQNKGHNLVAGINGDMFNISLGTMHYGAPLGLQVKDGEILVGFETIWSGPRYPVFALDKNRKPIITHVKMENRLSIIDAEYEKLHGEPNPKLTTTIDTINRNNNLVMNNQMILFTPKLANNPIIEFTDEQAYNANFTILKVKDSKDGGVKLGQEYEAEVVSIVDTSAEVKSITVPKDGMVLASQGAKATWIKEHLTEGDKVRFSFNLKNQAGRKLALDQAVSAYLPLVMNGRALTKEDMLEICKNDWDRGIATISGMDKARTAIGYTADNKVIALVFDGGGATSDSYGLDLPSMAKRLQELGVVAAVSLDGGGSTQMNTRLFGETEVKVINKPSDRKERPVSNTILFATNAPKANDINALKVNQDITIFKNNTYAFQVKGQDSNGHPVDLSGTDIKWKINSRNSLIDDKGVFKAGQSPEKLIVEAKLGQLKGMAEVNVVDEVDELIITDTGVLALNPNLPKQLHIKAYTKSGEPILITNEAAEWTVTPSSVATIDQNGLLIPLKKGDGVVRAKVGDKEVSLNFVSGLDAQLIDSYEDYDSNSYYIDGYVGGKSELSTDQVKEGQYSLKVDYDYLNWDKVYNGSINIRMKPDVDTSSYTTNIRPKKLGMWVYGDGKAPWLRAVLKDGNQNSHTVNLASRINWTGWNYVSVDIPDNIPMPITLNYFYMVETDKSRNSNGTVYFDDIRFIYNE